LETPPGEPKSFSAYSFCMKDSNMNTRATELAERIVSLATLEQCEALLGWAAELQSIRDSIDTPLRKAQRAVKATLKREVIAPVLKGISNDAEKVARKVKGLLWDDRGWPARMGMIGLTIATVGLSGKAAGLAAFGRAIGVPIWLVLTASRTFLGAIIEEIQKAFSIKAQQGQQPPTIPPYLYRRRARRSIPSLASSILEVFFRLPPKHLKIV
jgi:hypothetical protein